MNQPPDTLNSHRLPTKAGGIIIPPAFSRLVPTGGAYGIISSAVNNVETGNEFSSGTHHTVADSTGEGSFVALRVWLAGSPWRLTGGWMVLVGLVAYAGLDVLELPLLSLVLALTVAELLWTALWMQLVAPLNWPGRLARHRPALPYIAVSSPAARLLGWKQPGTLAAMVRGGLPLVLLSLLLAYLLSPMALALTLVAVALVILSVIARQAGLVGLLHWLHALLIAALPIALGISLTGEWPVVPESLWLTGLAIGAIMLARVAVEVRVLPFDWVGTGGSSLGLTLLTGLGIAALAGVMLFSQKPLALGLIVLLGAAPLLMLARPDRVGHGAFQAWCLALVLVAAVAVGLGLG